MILSLFRPAAVSVVALVAGASPLAAQTRAVPASDILVIGHQDDPPVEDTPGSHAGIDAATLSRTVNAVTVEDALKYLPSLVVRRRHIGDTQAPLATRTSGLGSSARSLIYADGALLSALIGNNNTLASPRWGLVSPQEIARVDVLYGPYSAAYPGNAIGAVVNITTRLPETLEGTITAATNVQRYDQYGTRGTFPAYQLGATLGDRFGPLALFASVDHVDSRSQPLLFVTVPRPAAASAAVTGGYDDLNRIGAPIRVLGASGLEHHVQDRIKLKAALDVSPAIRLSYVGALFLNDTEARAETYLTGAVTGLPVYDGGLSGGVYTYDERHWSHALSAIGSGGRFDWQVIGTLYDFAHDVQRIPTTALPGALAGGAGTITRLDGTGWRTLDVKGVWRSDADATHTFSLGAHGDRFTLDSNRYATTDWRRGGEGALTLQSRGRTRTLAVWAEDAWRVVPAVTLTVGGRYEDWRAFGGVNFSATPAIARVQPSRSARGFSPKASIAWDAAAAWTLRLSAGRAYRFPTVAELYQLVTTPLPAVPDPDLRPERAWSEELALEHHDGRGTARVALFHESIADALIAQTGPLNGTTTLATFVQNIERTRARGVEVAVQRSDVVARVDVSGSVTYADAETRANPAFPASIGKRLPSVPWWKATLVATWRPTEAVSLSAAGRYASRNYATLDNGDTVGNTYQGFYKYLVVDLRATVRVGDRYTLGLGVDNVTNDRYFLFHPFPQRSVQADVTVTL